MSCVFVTGSADGLGLMAARLLAAQGHQVIMHARNDARARDIAVGFLSGQEGAVGSLSGQEGAVGSLSGQEGGAALPQAGAVVTGDLSSIAQIRSVAEQVNALGRPDAVIHNAGVGYRGGRIETVDGLCHVFAINVLAPYLLTALITPPSRLVYLTSGMHRGGRADLSDPQWTRRRWSGTQAYSDSKLFDVLLAFGVARRWPGVRSNSVDPGWVATKMGGPGAPDNLSLGSVTQAWLAVSADPAADVTGQNFYHQQPSDPVAIARSAADQDALLDYCATLTGTPLPDPAGLSGGLSRD